jgi:hypothetical protein
MNAYVPLASGNHVEIIVIEIPNHKPIHKRCIETIGSQTTPNDSAFAGAFQIFDHTMDDLARIGIEGADAAPQRIY